MYSYGTVRFTCTFTYSSTSSLVGKTVEHSLLPTRLLILIHVKCTIPKNCMHNPLPEDEPSGSKHVEDIKN